MWRKSCVAGRAVLAAVSLLICCAEFAGADYSYDENVDGDLPHPNTAFVLPFGTPNPNSIDLTVGDNDSDGWILQVDPGETLRAFTLILFYPDVPSYTATFHMYDGPTLADPVLGTLFASFGHELLGVDFLEHFAIGPLGPGQYLFNFWHDNSSGPLMGFDIDMTGLSPVEEGTWAEIKHLYR